MSACHRQPRSTLSASKEKMQKVFQTLPFHEKKLNAGAMSGQKKKEKKLIARLQADDNLTMGKIQAFCTYYFHSLLSYSLHRGKTYFFFNIVVSLQGKSVF